MPAAAARTRNLTEEELIDWGPEMFASFSYLLLFLHIAYLFESQYYYVTVTVQFFNFLLAMFGPAYQFERMTGVQDFGFGQDYAGIVFVFCVCFYNYLFNYLNSNTITAAAAVITAATTVAAVLMRWRRWRR